MSDELKNSAKIIYKNGNDRRVMNLKDVLDVSGLEAVEITENFDATGANVSKGPLGNYGAIAVQNLGIAGYVELSWDGGVTPFLSLAKASSVDANDGGWAKLTPPITTPQANLFIKAEAGFTSDVKILALSV